MKVEILSYKESDKKKKAHCAYNGSVYRVSLSRQSGTLPQYRGSVSVLGADGSVIKWKAKVNGEIVEKAARVTLRVDSDSRDVICAKIEEGVIRAYKKFSSQIEKELGLAVRSDTITPAVAAQLHAKRFVYFKHGGSSEKHQKEIVNTIRDVASRLDNKPMCLFKKKDLNKQLKLMGASKNKIGELHKFWEYCLEKEICIGTNPVQVPARHRQSGKAKKSKANRINSLTLDKQEQLFDYLAKHNTGPNRGIALMLGGGISPEDATRLNWGDLIFGEEEDFVLVKDYKVFMGAATHNYTRPLFPRAALILRKAYDSLVEEFGELKTKNMPIVSYVLNPKKRIDKKRLSDEAKKILLRDYISKEDYLMIGDEDLDTAASSVILRNTYKNNLIDNCNLEKEPGTLAFLEGRSLGDNTTDDVYRSFTTEEASKRLYDILSCLREEGKVEPVQDVITSNGTTIKTIVPEARDYKRVYIEIELNPGEWFEIESQHEVEEMVKVIKQK